MNSTINQQTFTFNREDSDRWYIDLPDYPGQHADLEMVSGADTMLEYVGLGRPQVTLVLSEEAFEGASQLTLIDDQSDQPGGGGIYLLKAYNGEEINQEMWLCEVTAWLFGKLPQVIWFKLAE